MTLHYFEILYSMRSKFKFQKKGQSGTHAFGQKQLCITFICNCKKTKQIILQKQYFAFRISTLCHLRNSISQPLALVADTTATILTMFHGDYGE